MLNDLYDWDYWKAMRQPVTFIRRIIERQLQRQHDRQEMERAAAANRAEQANISRMKATNERTLRHRLQMSLN